MSCEQHTRDNTNNTSCDIIRFAFIRCTQLWISSASVTPTPMVSIAHETDIIDNLVLREWTQRPIHLFTYSSVVFYRTVLEICTGWWSWQMQKFILFVSHFHGQWYSRTIPQLQLWLSWFSWMDIRGCLPYRLGVNRCEWSLTLHLPLVGPT